MALVRLGKPRVTALARQGDVDGLVAAARFDDLTPAPGGGMSDRGAGVRAEAILALGSLGSDVGSDAVRAALSDPSDSVRVAAVGVLYAREEPLPIAAALSWLPAEGHSRPLAISTLAELRRPESAPAVAAALLHAPGDDPLREDEAGLLILLIEAEAGSHAATEVVEQLIVALGDTRDAVVARAEELLVLLAPVSTERVIAELKAGAPDRAAAVLAQMHALEPLMEGLHHRDARVRAECAGALGELRDPAAVEALIQASRDTDDRVRARADWALDRLGMVALVAGVSTMIRPLIQAAAAAARRAPAFAARENGSSGDNEFVAHGDFDSESDVEGGPDAYGAERPPDPTPSRGSSLLFRMDDVESMDEI